MPVPEIGGKLQHVRVGPLLLVVIPDREPERSAAVPVGHDKAVTCPGGAFFVACHLARDDRHGTKELHHPRAKSRVFDHVELALEVVLERVEILAVRVFRQVVCVAAIGLEARRQRPCFGAIGRIDLQHARVRAGGARAERKSETHRKSQCSAHDCFLPSDRPVRGMDFDRSRTVRLPMLRGRRCGTVNCQASAPLWRN